MSNEISNLTNSQDEIQKKSLTELKVEIKFHLEQMAGHAVEIGKLLIQAKEQVAHGDWQSWLTDNFNLKRQSAQNFMKIAERFGANYQSIGILNYTQMVQMLALPEGEEDKFISEKAAENKPVEDMTVKQLRAEIKLYKEKIDEVNIEREIAEDERDSYLDDLTELKETLEKERVENSKHESSLKQELREKDEKIDDLLLHSEEIRKDKVTFENQLNELKAQLASKNLVKVEVPPADYDETKKSLFNFQVENKKLKSELREIKNAQPIEVSATEFPEDYDQIKNELALLRDQQQKFDSAPYRNLVNLFAALSVLLNYSDLQEIFQLYYQNNPDTSQKMTQLSGLVVQLKNIFDICTNKKV